MSIQSIIAAVSRSPEMRARMLGLPLLLLLLSACMQTTAVEEEPPNGSPPPGSNPPPPPAPPSTAVDTIFYEGFEENNFNKWPDGYNATRHRIVTDAAGARSGSRYLEATYPAGSDGGFLNTFFMPGYDSVYVSFHVRLDANWQGGTKLLGLYGSRTDNRWSAFGRAGICPTGTDFFLAMVITEPSGGNPPPTRFYTYYHEMARSGSTCYGVYGDGSETYVAPLQLARGTWHRIEFWLKVNQPGQRDAVQRLWINGVERGSWSGISMRTSDILRINALQLSFNTCCGGAPQTQRVYMDEILVTRARPAN